jgi:hypothetical protein
MRPDGLFVWAWGPEPTFGVPELNVGWLDPRHEYQRGQSEDEFKLILEGMCNETKYHLWRAQLYCSLCERVLSGPLAAEIRVRGVDVVYAAPNVVSHHVAVHTYSPPREFVEAVLKSNGRQAEAVSGTTRVIPADVLVREHVHAEELLKHVVELVRAENEADQIYDISIVFDRNIFVVAATFAPQRTAELARRTWNVPADAILNIEQGSFGIGSMLSCMLKKRYDEVFRKGKKPLFGY